LTGYSGFGPLYQAADGQSPSVTEVACWAHVRRYFYDIHVTTNAPIAGEALQRIGNLFDVERTAMELPPEQRRRIRQSAARPLIDDLATFLDASLAMISGRSELPRRSVMPAPAGRRSRAISMTAPWRSATTPPSAPSARSRRRIHYALLRQVSGNIGI
jgi:hypothetical protein